MLIVDFGSEHWPAVRALYEGNFGRWSASRYAERWRWQFKDNPFTHDRASKVRVATVGDRVVGHIAGFPVPLWLDGHRYICLAGSDMVVSERYRSQSLMVLKDRIRWRPILDTGFTPTLEKIFRHLRFQLVPLSRRSLVYSLRYTGAVQRSLRQRLPRPLRILASRPLASCLGFFRKPDSALPKKPVPSAPITASLERLRVFDSDYDRFWLRLRSEFVWSVDRDARYMNWRYMEGPFRSTRAWKHTDSRGRINGVIVLGVRAELDRHRSPYGCSGEILEVLALPDNEALVEALVSHGVRELDMLGVDYVTALGLTPRYHAALRSVGFEVLDRPGFTMSFDSGFGERERSMLSENTDCYISSGDGDQTFGLVL